MTAETFAANLKAALIGKWLIGREEPRRNPLIVGMEVRVRSNPHPAGHWPVDLDQGRIMELLSGDRKPPTPAEISAIATAIGCPVERLTVSREELEEGLCEAREDAMREAREAEKWRLLHDKAAEDAIKAEAEIQRLLAEVDALKEAAFHAKMDARWDGC